MTLSLVRRTLKTGRPVLSRLRAQRFREQEHVPRWWLRWRVRQALRAAAPIAARLRQERASRPVQPVIQASIPETSAPEFPRQDPPVFIPPSALATHWLSGLSGLEIGAAAYNPFGLQTRNVGLSLELDARDFTFFRDYQLSMCGTFVPIDIPGHAEAIPVADDSQDFVLTSHVWEHLPNPLGALQEWVRVVRSGGYIFAIVPKRDAAPSDRGRPITPLVTHLVHYALTSRHEERAFEDGLTARSNHYSVFNPMSLFLIETWWNVTHPTMPLERVAFQLSDDKIGNGHAILWRVQKQ